MRRRIDHLTATTLPLMAAAATVLTVVAAPLTTIGRLAATVHDRLIDDDDPTGEEGAEMVTLALAAGLIALIVVAFYAVIEGKVMDEANNLPSSG